MTIVWENVVLQLIVVSVLVLAIYVLFKIGKKKGR